GGRFKKEIVVDGQSYLLLIRDEGGPPEAQVSTASSQIPQPNALVPSLYKASFKRTASVSFSLGSCTSLCVTCNYGFFSFCCPVDAISSSNPRVIDDARARKLSNDLKRCTYYETCATYGLNVER
ncbi:AGAP1 protein, partial [Ceuthmochares aereus]|nr:AGAP1 protein [Ceuthmochares aereus]